MAIPTNREDAYAKSIREMQSRPAAEQLEFIKTNLLDVFQMMDDMEWTIHPLHTGLVEIADLLGIEDKDIPTEGNRL